MNADTHPDTPHGSSLVDALRTTILERLGNANPYPLPESTLYVECKGMLASGVSDDEIARVIGEMKTDGLIRSSPHPIHRRKEIFYLTAMGVAAIEK